MLRKPLSDEEALRLSIDLWEYLARTGEDKCDAFMVGGAKGQHAAILEHGRPDADCWLCEKHYFNLRDIPKCPDCPLSQARHCCLDDESLWQCWDDSEDIEERKELAGEILVVLKEAAK